MKTDASPRLRILWVVLGVGLIVVAGGFLYFRFRFTGPRPDYSDIFYTDEPDDRRSLDIYLPSTNQGLAPVVVMFHGGLGNKSDFRYTAGQLSEQGFAVVLPSYRIEPLTYEDGFCALAWVYANADEYDLNVEYVYAVGWSSGGGIVAEMLAVDTPGDLLTDCPHEAQSDWLDAAVLFAAGSDRWQESGWRTDEPPVTWLDGSEPPVLLMHGERDDLIPVADSRQLAALLEASGVEVELVVLPDADHFFPVPGMAGYDEMLDALLSFLMDSMP